MLAGQRRLHFEDNARRAHVWMEWMRDSSSHFWLGGMAQGETWLSVRCSGVEVNSPCSAGKQVWKQLVWGQLSVCSVCHINHSPLPSIGWPVADLTAATGSNTLISERVSPFSQCQVGQQKRESGKKKKINACLSCRLSHYLYNSWECALLYRHWCMGRIRVLCCRPSSQ